VVRPRGDTEEDSVTTQKPQGSEPITVEGAAAGRKLTAGETNAAFAHVQAICREANLPTLYPILEEALLVAEGADPEKVLAFDTTQAWAIHDDIWCAAVVAIQQRFA
jgi:hypothetical protein